jgi:hypothetical protein
VIVYVYSCQDLVVTLERWGDDEYMIPDYKLKVRVFKHRKYFFGSGPLDPYSCITYPDPGGQLITDLA